MIDDVLPDGHPRDQIISTAFNPIIVCGSNKVSAEIIYVALLVHQVFLIFTLNLNALEAFSCEVVRVVNVDDVLIVFLSGNPDNCSI
jgi:hypothetical protein